MTRPYFPNSREFSHTWVLTLPDLFLINHHSSRVRHSWHTAHEQQSRLKPPRGPPALSSDNAESARLRGSRCFFRARYRSQSCAEPRPRQPRAVLLSWHPLNGRAQVAGSIIIIIMDLCVEKFGIVSYRPCLSVRPLPSPS